MDEAMPYLSQLGVDWQCMRLEMMPDGGIQYPDYWDGVYETLRANGLKCEIDLAVYSHRLLPTSTDFRPNAVPSAESMDMEKFTAMWSKFVDDVQQKYSPDLIEVWSEFTDHNYWGEHVRVQDYGILLKMAKDVIGSRSLVGLGGFFMGIKPIWWEKLAAAGVVDHCDVVCLHPYVNVWDISRILEAQDIQMAEIRRQRPIYITEMGLPIVGGEGRIVSSYFKSNAKVRGLSDAEGAQWWGQLLAMWDKYCEAVSCYFRTNLPEEGYSDPNFWGNYIGIGGKAEVLEVFRGYFPPTGG